MKKYISTVLTAAAVMIGIQMFTGAASAQGRTWDRERDGRYSRNDHRRDERRQDQVIYGNRGTYGNSGYYGNTSTYDPYYTGSSNVYYDPYYDAYYNGTSTYDRHRKAVNIGVGAGVGAAVGAMVGGAKGAAIGAAAGAIGGAIVTAAQAPRNYPRYY